MISLLAFRKHKGVSGISFNESYPLNNVLEKLPTLTVEYEDELFAFTQSDLSFDIYDPSRSYAFLTDPDMFITLRNNNATLYTGEIVNFDYRHKSKTMRLQTISITDILNRSGKAWETGFNFFRYSYDVTLLDALYYLLNDKSWIGYNHNEDPENAFGINFQSDRELCGIRVDAGSLLTTPGSFYLTGGTSGTMIGMNISDIIRDLFYIMNLEMKLSDTHLVIRDREYNVEPLIILNDVKNEDIHEKTSKESYTGVRITTAPTSTKANGRLAEIGNMRSPLDLQLDMINNIMARVYHATGTPAYTSEYKEDLITEVAQNLNQLISINVQYEIKLHGLDYSIFNSYQIPYLGKVVKPKKLVYDFNNETTKMTCIG